MLLEVASRGHDDDAFQGLTEVGTEMSSIPRDQMGRVGCEGACQDRQVFGWQIDGGSETLGELDLGNEGHVVEDFFESGALL